MKSVMAPSEAAASPCATWPACAMAVTSPAFWMMVFEAETTETTVDSASWLTPEALAMVSRAPPSAVSLRSTGLLPAAVMALAIALNTASWDPPTAEIWATVLWT
ncbi:hypothetical protein ACVWWG_005246 [Bradyrhizobium sp. LB7.2]